jgi:small subunit ribosomal protein S16
LAVKLRLARMGKKKQPYYRIVAADSRTRRDGKYIEKIGHYNPLVNPAEVMIDEEKAFYWLKNGAIPTETVKSLFSQKGILLKWHYIRDGHDEAKVEEEYKKWDLLQQERQKREEALAAQAKREPKPKTTEEEQAQDTKEETVAEAMPEPSIQEAPESLEEQSQEPVESQPESEASEPEVEESQPEEQKSETLPIEETEENKEK